MCAAILTMTVVLPGVVLGQDANPISEGARVYGNTCGRCHNPRSPLEQDDQGWAVIMNHMRVKANLTRSQVRNVLAFLQASNTDPRERANPFGETPPAAATTDTTLSTDPAVISQGQTIVQERACLGCHVVNGQGGAVGPSLDNSIEDRGAGFVMRKIADPTFDKATSMMPNFGLTPEQVRAVASYLATLRRPSAD